MKATFRPLTPTMPMWPTRQLNPQRSKITPEASSKRHSVALVIVVWAAGLVVSRAPADQIMKPNEISELGLWLSASDLAEDHADGQPVKRWQDRSDRGYDAVFEGRIPQTVLRLGVHRPPTFQASALAGRPAVSFNVAERQTLILNRAGHALGQNTSGFSAAFVVRPGLVYGPAPAADAQWGKTRYLFISHVSDYSTRVAVQIVEDTGEVRLLSRSQPKQRLDANSSFADARRLALGSNAWHRLIVTVDYEAKESRIVIDWTTIVRALPPSSLDVFEDVPSPVTAFGSNSLGSWLTCQYPEVICYEKALGIDEVQSLDAYLCEKYSLPR